MTNLKGNSGCTITLIDNTIIRKQSKNINYNNRLLKQIEKQKTYIHPIIKTPKIYEIGEKNNLIYFDMEYIKGQSFFDFCSLEKFTEIEKIINIFFSKTTSTNTKNVYDIVLKKCKTFDDFPLHILDDVSWECEIKTCHGDFTFENIIIRDNEIYLIDFLDSFLESPQIDKSKMMQDTYCFWSYRNKKYTPIHNLYLINQLLETKQNYILLLVHLYRILPYSDGETKKWLDKQIQNVMKKIKNI